MLDGCWQAHEEHVASRDRRVWAPSCQQEADREQPVSLQGHCVLWKTSLSSVFPLVPCLEESQSHREGTGMGTTVTDFYSQHISERADSEESISVQIVLPDTICSELCKYYTCPRLPELVAFSQYRRSQIWESKKEIKTSDKLVLTILENQGPFRTGSCESPVLKWPWGFSSVLFFPWSLSTCQGQPRSLSYSWRCPKVILEAFQ